RVVESERDGCRARRGCRLTYGRTGASPVLGILSVTDTDEHDVVAFGLHDERGTNLALVGETFRAAHDGVVNRFRQAGNRRGSFLAVTNRNGDEIRRKLGGFATGNPDVHRDSSG